MKTERELLAERDALLTQARDTEHQGRDRKPGIYG